MEHPAKPHATFESGARAMMERIDGKAGGPHIEAFRANAADPLHAAFPAKAIVRSGPSGMPLAGEAMVVAVCRVLHSSFPRTKIIFDVCLVVSALTLSFAAAGKIEGVREGTLAAALCVGLTVKAANKFVVPMAKRFIA